MPTYRNDSGTIYMVKDRWFNEVAVKPGGTVETFVDLSGLEGMVEIAATPRSARLITAENQWTDWMPLEGPFGMSVSGAFVGTVTLQRSIDGGATPLDVNTFTGPFEGADHAPGRGKMAAHEVYRVGVKAGGWTSGTAAVALWM